MSETAHRLRGWFLQHPWLKLIALLCAVVTWLAIQTQLDGRHLLQTSSAPPPISNP